MSKRRKVTYEEGKAKSMKCEFLEVSAKDNKNVEESFHTFLKHLQIEGGI